MLLETLNALLMIEDNQLVEDLISTVLSSPELVLLLETGTALRRMTSDYLLNKREQLTRQLQQANVAPNLAAEVCYYQQCQLLTSPQFSAGLTQTLQQLQQLNSSFVQQAQQLITHNNQFTPALQALFMQRWRVQLLMQANAFNQQLLDLQREQLISELQKRVKLTYTLLPVLAENDNAAGKLWDMSSGRQHLEDYQLIVQYSDFLASQPELLQLAQQLGRSRRKQLQPEQLAPPVTAPLLIREPGIMPEQLNGLHRSSDILRLLPAEQATLAIAELDYEFYRRMLENTLLTYQLCGEQWREKPRPHPAARRPQELQPPGAFLVCVDCSGSMGGFNEQCAKAFCLALARIALAEQRPCFVLLFSSELVSYQLSAQQGAEQLIRFLSQRFRGGTDLAHCLAVCVEKIQQQDWQNADVVVISDFIAQRLPVDLSQQIQRLQPQHRFHAIATSAHGKAGIMQIFDYIWHFDTSLRARILRHWQR